MFNPNSTAVFKDQGVDTGLGYVSLLKSVTYFMSLKDYVILFAQSFEDFRFQELESLAILEGIKADFSNHHKHTPYLIVRLENDTQAKKLIRRSICCRAIYSLWACAKSYNDLHFILRQSGFTDIKKEPFRHASFKFVVESFNKSHSIEHQIALINSFSYLALEGPVFMNNPEEIYAILEEWTVDSLKYVFMGRQIAKSSRHAVNWFNLKKRRYIGNTSMDAELSLIIANQALAEKGKLVYDPFVGTGSILLACAYYEAMIMGTDIDGRLLRGQNGRSIHSNLEQYGLTSKFLDIFTMDFLHPAIRDSLLLDIIICDPPYGLRASPKTLRKNVKNTSPPKDASGCYFHLKKDYIPPTEPYSFDELIAKLMTFASDHLLTEGRLVFWMPSMEEKPEASVPQHPNLLLIANSKQCFGKWSRKLLTYVRKDRTVFNQNVTPEIIENKFREKYFTSKNK
ncbi:hypothetical protein PNEG_03418 [Pneumocystis murina B123]|uniref:tRNA (guanine(10)-N(2))-methyltransferase n=1 Tax=Pneumocystis murina (strain B123) TaxID=1069680 RepID=M7NM92_PNEMU|nr:hypothetical protein PNEG_03418 [Pneumocystis murina B123]EMR08251.1 hypothetical protein PNEG_03418 [Pneumocystis murina B123]